MVTRSAAAAVPAAPDNEPSKGFEWMGAAPLPFVLSVGVGLAVRFLVPGRWVEEGSGRITHNLAGKCN